MITNNILKKKILDNAIHGALVKNDNTLKPVNIDSVNTDIPFEVPYNWKWCYIKSIAKCKTGNSINETEKRKNYSNMDCDGLFYIGTKDIEQNNYINYTNGIKIPNESISKFKIAKKDSSLICIEGGSAGKKVGFVNQDVCYVNKLCNIYSEVINNKYIYYFLQSAFFINEFDSKKNGIIGGVSVKNFEQLLIPIPPLEEQKRIVEEIDVLIDLIDKKEKNDIEKDKLKEVLKIKILDNAIHGNLVEKHTELNAKKFVEELKQAKDEYIINNKLSKSKDSNTKNELFDIPNHWCWTTLGDICFVTKLAGFEYTKYVAKDLSSTGEVPVVRAQNIKPNLFVDNCQEFISNDLSQKLYRCALDSKCVLMTFIGAGIGEVCVFDKEKRYHLAPNVAKIVPGIDINKYIMYYLMSKEGKKNIFDYKKSTAQASLSMETIRNVVIPIPPFVELKEIVEKIESLFQLIEQLY